MGVAAASPAPGERRNWVLVLLGWLVDRLRPRLGWFTFLGALSLNLLATLAIRDAGWVNLGRIGVTLEWVGPLALLTVWLLWGWTLPWRQRGRHWARLVGNGVVLLGTLFIGTVTVSQVLIHWIPGPFRLWRTAQDETWLLLGQQIAGDLLRLWLRLADWWQGVQAGGALQDDLVFVALAATILWLVGALTGWLALRSQNGLLLSMPPLWLLALALYYGTSQRLLLVLGIGLAMSLHLWLDQQTLFQRWQREGTDYNPVLVYDRLFAFVGISVVVLALALILPNLYIQALSWRAYQAMSPAYDQMEALGKRLFPDLDRSFRGRRGGIAGGLPNSFLLGSGPDLGDMEIMRVTTNQPGATPPGHYMRGATFSIYDGHGWQNPTGLPRREFPANEPWYTQESMDRGMLRQYVRLTQSSQILYATGEPILPEVNYQAQMRSPRDLVALWTDARSYGVLSAVPALDEATLAALPGWGPDRPLPPEMEAHLVLPDTVTDRTRQLASQLTQGLTSPFEKAQAIQDYLRGYEYDLSVQKPPRDVDVADFFLFDLQRGYCDYYATAFAVLARLNGLPTRFATGYAIGSWWPEEREWIVTEAEAHSWPEVYFPEVGWVAFEPTAGRPQLQRVTVPIASETDLETTVPPVELAEQTPPQPFWNWQMLFWLLPIIALLWWAGSIWLARRRRQEDPWQGLLNWGRRLGRPARSDETELEYGNQLAIYLQSEISSQPEQVRQTVRSVIAISRDVSLARYGPTAGRNQAWARASQHWQEIRSLFWRFWAAMRMR